MMSARSVPSPRPSLGRKPSCAGLRPLIAAGLLLLVPVGAQAAVVEVAGVKASSTYPPDDGGSYDADRVIDGKVSTSWVEGDDGSGLGAWIELDLGGTKEVEAIQIWAGMWYTSNYWNRANRPKEIELEFSDGSKHTCALDDEQVAQRCAFGTKQTRSIKLTLKQVYGGTAWHDTGISEILVFDGAPSDRVPVREVKASSTLPADGDGNYEPLNVQDRMVDTMWCEGSKDGDGTGEWLEFHFDGSPTVSKLSLINGVGGSMATWFKANRATSATLTFSDGSKEQVALKNSFKLETVSFSPKSTSSVRITFDAVTKGREFNDLCISEAYFTP